MANATDKLGTLLGKIHKYRATLVVENICEMRPNTEDNKIPYLDLCVRVYVDVETLRYDNRTPVRESIASMIVGGVSWRVSEFTNGGG